MELREGWNVAVGYGEDARERDLVAERVGFADRSNLLKLELQADRELLAGIVAAASGGHALEPGHAVRSGGAWWCPVTPSPRVLVLGEPAHAPRIRAAVADAFEDARATATTTDVTSGLAALTLAGPGARELLARFCAIDVRPAAMPVGAFRPARSRIAPATCYARAKSGSSCSWAGRSATTCGRSWPTPPSASAVARWGSMR